MRNFSRLLCAGVALVAVAAVIGCGGGGEQTSSEQVDPELLVSNPSAALGASAQRFEEQIESVEAEFAFEFGIDGIVVGADGHFAYQAPDSVHMTMEMSGGDGEMFSPGEFGPIEMLVLGEDLYMNTGFTGWMTMSLDDLGADAESLREMMDVHGGNTYTRLRITTDLASVMDAMMDSAGEDTLGADLFGVSGPMTMDILMNPVTLLPYMFEANSEFGFGGEAMEFKMAFKFFDYNGPVDIPAPPEDAQPFDGGFGDLGFGE